MTSTFHRIALIGKYHGAHLGTAGMHSPDALLTVAHFLVKQGCDVVIEHDWAHRMGVFDFPCLALDAIAVSCDLAVVVGGDGTMLGIGRQLAAFNVPLIGINQGRLGFITDIPYSSFSDCLTPMLHGEYIEDQRSLMDGRVMRDGQCVFSAMAMNDVVVNRGATAGMVELRVEVDGHFVANQRADGLIVATATGSTAYSLSAGGPLLHPSVGGWVLAPIAPHTLSNRPIVLANTSVITLEIVAGRDASASFDTQSLASLMIGDRIDVRQSVHHVRFLHPKGWSYFNTLREKLHWNEKVVLL